MFSSSTLIGKPAQSRRSAFTTQLRTHTRKAPVQAWKPIRYNAQDEAQARALSELIKEKTGLFIHDTLDEQLGDLCETRHPGKKLSKAEIKGWITAHLSGCPAALYGTWVYYPWAERLIHLLPEEEFVELRTNRNKYKITDEEQALLGTKRVGVVGLSVGQSVSLTLAQERGFKEIRLADFDTLELSNLNRIRTGLHNLGAPKVAVTAREIAEIDPYLKVTCFPEGISAETIESFLFEGGKLDLIIDECDSIDIKFMLRDVARSHRIPVVMDTSDRGMIDIERFDLEPQRPLFHGLTPEVDTTSLASLTTEEKIPFVLDIIGLDTMSTRMRASLIEVDESIPTWPQLASSVVSGGALTADVVRRIFLQQIHASGRYFADIESIIPSTPSPESSPRQDVRVCTGNEVQDAVAIAQTLHETDLPSGMEVPDATLEHLVRNAIMAPSGGNNQPWIWIIDRGRLTLHLDSSKISPFTDFQSAGSVASLGAAAENVLISARQLGLRARISPVYVADSTNFTVSFSFAEGGIAPRPGLSAHIERRHTNRILTPRTPLHPGDFRDIEQAVGEIEGANVQFVTDPRELSLLGELIGRADRLRFLDQNFNRELFNELSFSPDAREGIALDTLELTAVDRAGVSVCRHWDSMNLIRQWNLGNKLAQMSQKSVSCASAMGLITMPGATSKQYFEGGRALQRAWLTATRSGIAFWPMTILPYLFARLFRGQGEGLTEVMTNELIELRSLYTRLFNVLDTEGEVMLFRLAIAPDASARSLRRPVQDVLHIIH